MSNLPFLSKTIERVVAARPSAHMPEYNLCEPNQSAYKPNHGVEMALSCVENDNLRAMDNRNIVIMFLLHLPAAFDAVDHNVMLHRLSRDIGVAQTALDWFKSHLSEEFNLSILMFVRRLLDLSRVGSLKVLYSLRSCSLFMQHHYRKSFGTTT